MNGIGIWYGGIYGGDDGTYGGDAGIQLSANGGTYGGSGIFQQLPVNISLTAALSAVDKSI